MIDYDKPDDDPVIAEVRRSPPGPAGFNFDLRAICEEMQRRQASSGRRYASVPHRRAESGPSEPTKKAG